LCGFSKTKSIDQIVLWSQVGRTKCHKACTPSIAHRTPIKVPNHPLTPNLIVDSHTSNNRFTIVLLSL
jgi:hypothetical protein